MVTIKDVAKKSGFSVATVSAVINNVPVVSPKARQQILAAIEELGYRPNYVARSLKSQKTSSLAIMVRDITNPFYPDVVMGFEEVAWANNYEVFLCNTENVLERESKYINNLISKKVDGVIIATSFIKRNKEYDKLKEAGIPYVFVNRKPGQMRDYEAFVGSDNRLASEKAIRHLSALGHRRIQYLSGPLQMSTFKERFEGYIEGMAKLGLPVEDRAIMIGSDFSEQIGYELAKQMLKAPSLPDAVFCSNDLMAFGVHRAFKEAGVSIPDDVALVGLDNNRYSHLIELTSVDPQHREMGRTAARLLLDMIANSDSDSLPKEVLLEPEVVVRSTCGASRFKTDRLQNLG